MAFKPTRQEIYFSSESGLNEVSIRLIKHTGTGVIFQQVKYCLKPPWTVEQLIEKVTDFFPETVRWPGKDKDLNWLTMWMKSHGMIEDEPKK